MVSRWAYEAMAVNQFKNNEYRRHIFDDEVARNNFEFKTFYLVPEIKVYLDNYRIHFQKGEKQQASLVEPILKNSFADLFLELGHVGDSLTNAFKSIGSNSFSLGSSRKLSAYLDFAKAEYKKQYDIASRELEQTKLELLYQLGGDKDEYMRFINRYTNNKLNGLLHDRFALQKIYVHDNRIYQGDEPIYRQPVQNNGSAHFYASFKQLGKNKIDTFYFNIVIIWLLTFLLMIALYFDLLRKTIAYFESWRLLRQAKFREKIQSNAEAFSVKKE